MNESIYWKFWLHTIIVPSLNSTLLKVHENKKTKSVVENRKECNCQASKREKCPLRGKCQQRNVVYKATLPPTQMPRVTEHFKPCLHTHKQSFRNEELKKATCLSTYVWEKGLGTEPDIKWEIFDRAPPYNPGQKVCQLCLTEKLHIIEQCKKKNCLNQRSEVCQICRHKASYRLGRVKGATWQCVAKSWTVINTLLTSCSPDSFLT